MPTVVFDVNQTLLDLSIIRPFFADRFGDAQVMREWFGQLLQSAMTVSLTGSYDDFVSIGGAALEVIGRRHEVEISAADRAEIARLMVTLPPHEDEVPALRKLSDAGATIAALTNSPQATAEAQLASAGVADRFDQMLSVEAVKRYKPAPEPYRMAASALGVDVGEMWMVAAHDWDIAGAMAAGCRGALVTRPGVVPNPAYPAPDVSGDNLREVIEAILAMEG